MIIHAYHDGDVPVIKTFGTKQTEEFWRTGSSAKIPQHIYSAAKRKLQMVDSAHTLRMKSPPGNNLHPLEEDREGQHGISINDQYRVCFTWRDGDAYDVEITDYH